MNDPQIRFKTVPCSPAFQQRLDKLNQDLTNPVAHFSDDGEYSHSARLRHTDHQYRQAYALIREEYLLPRIRDIITPFKTLVYASHPQSPEYLFNAIVRSTPTGQPTFVNRLIHLSEPVSQEDRWLREQNVFCSEIVTVIISGIDPAPPTVQPSRHKLTGQKIREVLLAREFIA